MRGEKYDGMIITGAPVEQLDFEEVTYWDESNGNIRLGRVRMLRPLFIYVGLHRPDFIIIMEYPSMRWIRKCSAYSSIVL